MSKIIKNGQTYCESVLVKELPASDITYNQHNELISGNVQGAIDELADKIIAMNNIINELSAEVQELKSNINSN